MKKRIVILVHENTKRAQMRLYFVAQLAQCWRESGFRAVALRHADKPPTGDLLFMHVDLSRVPDHYLATARGFAASVNARVADIRKSAISRHLLRPDSDWDGPVIVKTDLNCAGLPEERYEGTRGAGHPARVKTAAGYRVLPGLRSVPEEVFANPQLVVEAFLPEPADGGYCIRSYNFLGDAEDCFLAWSDRPIINMNSIKRIEQTEVHPQIRQLREELGFDYGKFDYTVRDGRAILFDANKTPGTLPARTAEARALIRRRAEGIRGFLR